MKTEKENIRYELRLKKEIRDQELWEWTKAFWNVFFIIAVLVSAIFVLGSCSSRDEDPTPAPPKVSQFSNDLVGSWKVLKKKNVSGYIDNTDTSLYITISPSTIKYKLQNGGVYDGSATIENTSNADQATLTNGTKSTLFKTILSDGTQNFYFVHSSGLTDDIIVKKN